MDRGFICFFLLLILIGITLAAGWPVHSSASPAAPTTAAVWSWGRNFRGQLGLDFNDTSPHAIPAEVTALDSVIAIAADDTYSLALKSDGTVWAWGDNTEGQLGDGTFLERHSPVPVSGLSGSNAVAAGWGHSLARKVDGTLLSWGANEFGQLGDGTTTGRATPGPVIGLSGVSAMAAAHEYDLAISSRTHPTATPSTTALSPTATFSPTPSQTPSGHTPLPTHTPIAPYALTHSSPSPDPHPAGR